MAQTDGQFFSKSKQALPNNLSYPPAISGKGAIASTVIVKTYPLDALRTYGPGDVLKFKIQIPGGIDLGSLRLNYGVRTTNDFTANAYKTRMQPSAITTSDQGQYPYGGDVSPHNYAGTCFSRLSTFFQNFNVEQFNFWNKTFHMFAWAHVTE